MKHIFKNWISLAVAMLAICSATTWGAASSQERINRGEAESVAAKVAMQPDGALWPGFAPAKVPLAIFDGERTWVFGHPHTLNNYGPGPHGSQTRTGRDPAIIANSNAEIGGVGTATLLLGDASKARTADELAAVAVHEAFHVFQRRQHPKWAGNEADLFTYPIDNAEILSARREETLALRRALAAGSASKLSCWSRTALAARQKRFGMLSAEHVAYERGTELNEGLATYVQGIFSGKGPTLPENDYPAAQVRQRAYSTGAAIATLLDRSAPGWKASLDTNDSQHLDQLLLAAVGEGDTCQLEASVRPRLSAQAVVEVAALTDERSRQLMRFTQAPGWRVVVVADAAPLWPQGFDPLNVEQIAPGRLLHTRFVKLGNEMGEMEVLGKASLSDGQGVHPLFQGVKKIEIGGLDKPKLTEQGPRTLLSADGLHLSFVGANVNERDQVLTVTLSAPPASK